MPMTGGERDVFVSEIVQIFSDAKGVYKTAVHMRIEAIAKQRSLVIDSKTVDMITAEVCFELKHKGLNIVNR